MKIVYLAAGAGNMYCGSCMQGNTLVAALRSQGHNCLLLPLYTPLRTDEPNLSDDRVVFGGINVYLQQHSTVFRHTPWAFDRLFDRPALLRWATNRSSSVRPEHLGALTVSMLRGERGRQRKEVAKLLRCLAELNPDLVHLNNALLLGVAGPIRRKLGVPVVCSLSGEDSFLEKLPEPYRGEALEVLQQQAAEAAVLVAMNNYYAEFMAHYLAVPLERIEVVPPGLNLADHGTRQPHAGPPIVGFLARICPDKGLHHLTAALKILAADQRLPPVEVHAAGYCDAADRPYLQEIKREMVDGRLSSRFRYLGELHRSAKIAFLQSIDVFCLPTVYHESKGLPVLEAWANAVPAVLPRHGTFPELIADTGGGLLCEPEDPAALASSLQHLLTDQRFADRCGRQAQQAVHLRYTAGEMACRMSEVYQRIVEEG